MTVSQLLRLTSSSRSAVMATLARANVARSATATNIMNNNRTIIRLFSGPMSGADNITYSGGQATQGQGGYYGSGGARATTDDDTEASKNKTDAARPMVLAMATDVQNIQRVMSELDTLENLLQSSQGDVSKSIEIKSSIKKLMTSPQVLESLQRLELQGEPIWGLSTDEREMIVQARQKVNEC